MVCVSGGAELGGQITPGRQAARQTITSGSRNLPTINGRLTPMARIGAAGGVLMVRADPSGFKAASRHCVMAYGQP